MKRNVKKLKVISSYYQNQSTHNKKISSFMGSARMNALEDAYNTLSKIKTQKKQKK